MSEHDLNTPGGMIRSRREERKLSLADLSESTKIPTPVLEAVERNEFHKVSGALYIKSFLRTCAAQLGLEEEEVLAKYAHFSGEFESTSAEGGSQWREEDVQISRIGLPWRLIGIVGAVVAAFLVVILLTARGCGSESDEAINTGPASEITADEIKSSNDSEPSNEPAVVDNAPLAEEQEVVDEESPPQRVEAFAASDSLSRSFETSPVPQKVAVKVVASEQNDAPQVPSENQNERINASFPAARIGNEGIKFSGAEARQVVLRITCESQVNIEVKRDAERSFSAVQWPSNLNNIRPLPLEEIDAGRPYRVAEGFVVYWGAVDHFSLKLGSTQKVAVTLNGVLRNVSRLKPGGELVLDLHGN